MSRENIAFEIQQYAAAHENAIDFGNGNTVKSDIIAESTSGVGVTIDSVLLKDNIVKANSANFGDSLCLIDGSGNLEARTISSTDNPFGYKAGANGSVTQTGNASTGVTLNKAAGQITTVALTTAAGAEERFTVSSDEVGVKGVVILSTTYDGAGTPILGVVKMASGAFDIVITNVHASNAFDAVMVINFAVIQVV